MPQIDHGTLSGLADDDHPQYVLHTEVDDVPVNGATTDPISSNWAFDHFAAAVMDGDAAGGVLSGTYPNPGFAVDMATQAELDAAIAGLPLTHNLLSTTHTDTLAGTVVRGDLIVGNATPAWSRLPKGTAAYFLQMGANDPAWFDLFGTHNTWTKGQTIALGTLTADEKFLELSATWNNAGVGFIAQSITITDTLSASVSQLASWSVGGFEKFGVFKDGRVSIAGGLFIAPNTNQIVLGTTNTGTISMAAISGGNKTWTFPNVTGTVALLEAPNVFTVNQTISKASPVLTLTDTTPNPDVSLTLSGMGDGTFQLDAGGNLTWIFDGVTGNNTFSSEGVVIINTSVGIGVTPTSLLHIASTAPTFTMTDTTASAKSLTIAVDANKADFRESAGASGSLLILDLAGGRVGIGQSPGTDNWLDVFGNDSNRVSVMVANSNSGGNASLYVQNNRGSLAVYGGILTGGSADATGNLFGVTRADKTFIFADGASSLGLAIGTLVNMPVIFGVNNAEVMRMTATGLGIGVTPNTPLHVLSATDNATLITATINIASASITTADTFVDFRSSAGSIGSIAGTAVSGTIIYNTFTGAHWTEIVDRTGLELGMLLESTGEPLDDFAAMTKSQICGRRASKAAWGMYNGRNNEGRDSAEAIGKGLCWVVNKGEPLEVGDFVMSSDVPGACEKQPDDIYRNYTVAKVMQPVVWEPGEVLRKQVACIYLGG